MAELKKAVKAALDQKFPRDELLVLAYSLDVRFKDLIGRYTTVNEIQNGIKTFLEKIGESYSTYATPETSTEKPETSDDLFRELFADLQEDSATLNDIPSLSKEIHDFLLISAPGGDRSSINLLEWWKKHENAFPILSKIARKVLGIVATSAPSERVFSIAGNIITQKRYEQMLLIQ